MVASFRSVAATMLSDLPLHRVTEADEQDHKVAHSGYRLDPAIRSDTPPKWLICICLAGIRGDEWHHDFQPWHKPPSCGVRKHAIPDLLVQSLGFACSDCLQ